MKNLLFSIAAVTTLALTNVPLPARAASYCNSSGDPLVSGSLFYTDPGDFNPWEHPFGCDNNIGGMPQWAADAYCGGIFADYAETQFFQYGIIVHTSHAWAHLNDRVCVYND